MLKKGRIRIIRYLPVLCPISALVSVGSGIYGWFIWRFSIWRGLAAIILAVCALYVFCMVIGILIADYSTLANVLGNMSSSQDGDRRQPKYKGYFENSIKLVLDYQASQYRSDILYKQAEANALQNQINPHFLYNTLESIRGHALAENCASIAEMAEALSSMFRYSISKGEMVTTIQAELENVSNYFAIQKYRFGDKFAIQQTVESDYLMEATIPKLTIQPLVENAIYHGLGEKSERGEISIAVLEQGNCVVIRVKDDGVGMTDEQLKKTLRSLNNPHASPNEDSSISGSGIALSNINDRIHFIFGDQYGISIHSVLSLGTTVEVILPYVKRRTAEL